VDAGISSLAFATFSRSFLLVLSNACLSANISQRKRHGQIDYNGPPSNSAGSVKKTLVADQLGSMIGYIDTLQPQHSELLWLSTCLYAPNLYLDFTALTDVAVGTAALLGIRSPENFDHSFFAPVISQCWHCWHMSLTRRRTDYVFTPLRMEMRNLGKLGLAVSITINMVLIGLWHGFNIGFLHFAWGTALISSGTPLQARPGSDSTVGSSHTVGLVS
jgi:hypothetical protein